MTIPPTTAQKCPPTYIFYTGNQSCIDCPYTCQSCVESSDFAEYVCDQCPTGGRLVFPSPKPQSSHQSGGKCIYHCNETADSPIYSPVDPRLRLRPLKDRPRTEGVLEVFYNRSWRGVCDDGWSSQNTDVVCRHLRMGNAAAGKSHFSPVGDSWFATYNIQIGFDNVRCSGSESFLLDCNMSTFMVHNCDWYEVQAVSCSGPVQGDRCDNSCPKEHLLKQGSIHPLICEPCESPCVECTGSTSHCSECENHLYLYEGICLSTCPTGYYKEDTVRKCMRCERQCEECKNTSHCFSCKPGRLLSSGKCLSQCPTGTVQMQLGITAASCLPACPTGTFEIASMCKPCDASCRACFSDSKNCSMCFGTKVLQPVSDRSATTYKCLNQCSKGYHSTWPGLCQPCVQSSCIDCYPGGNYCKQCRMGFLFQQGRCTRTCNTGLNPANGECIFPCPTGSVMGFDMAARTLKCYLCPENCLKCANVSFCLSCVNKFFLDKGRCVAQCAENAIELLVKKEDRLRLVGGSGSLDGGVEVFDGGRYKLIINQVKKNNPYVHQASTICSLNKTHEIPG